MNEYSRIQQFEQKDRRRPRLEHKNTAEGRVAAAKYSGIINRSRPEPSIRHPRMPVSARVKIFSPFSALRGYDEELALEKNKRFLIPKRTLSEEESRILSERMVRLTKGTKAAIRNFSANPLYPDPPLGTYEELSGRIVWVDPAARQLCIEKDRTESVIAIEEIDEIILSDSPPSR